MHTATAKVAISAKGAFTAPRPSDIVRCKRTCHGCVWTFEVCDCDEELPLDVQQRATTAPTAANTKPQLLIRRRKHILQLLLQQAAILADWTKQQYFPVPLLALSHSANATVQHTRVYKPRRSQRCNILKHVKKDTPTHTQHNTAK